jgi:hypothetical protein
VPVLEEVRASADAACPARGPFSLLYIPANDACGPLAADPLPDRGLASVRINYPFQATTLTAYQAVPPTATEPFPPNVSAPVLASEGDVIALNDPPGGLLGDNGETGPYAGPHGLGRYYALAGKVVRPFRRVVSVQAIYRREVFE